MQNVLELMVASQLGGKLKLKLTQCKVQQIQEDRCTMKVPCSTQLDVTKLVGG